MRRLQSLNIELLLAVAIPIPELAPVIRITLFSRLRNLYFISPPFRFCYIERNLTPLGFNNSWCWQRHDEITLKAFGSYVRHQTVAHVPR